MSAQFKPQPRTCPDCGTRQSVNVSGALRGHKVPRAPEPCAGSGRNEAGQLLRQPLPRGTCPDCGAQRPLTKKGSLRRHRLSVRGQLLPCTGSGKRAAAW